MKTHIIQLLMNYYNFNIEKFNFIAIITSLKGVTQFMIIAFFTI